MGHRAISTVVKAVCHYAVLAQLGLIQGNSRCFGAHCKMSRNTRFLCYFFGLKYSSVLFSTLFPSLGCEGHLCCHYLVTKLQIDKVASLSAQFASIRTSL